LRCGWRGGGESQKLGRLSLSREEETRKKGDSGSLAAAAFTAVVIDVASAAAEFTAVVTDAASGIFKEKRPLSHTQEEETRKRSNSGGFVLAGDTADGDWRRRRRPSPVVGPAVAA